MQAQTSQSGSIGIEGTIPSAPPTQAATITFPRDGATITDLPVTVTGLCPTGLLVKIFKNNVFGGSAQCVNGTYSIKIDLFSGRNELVARVYDALDQAGPDSNMVAVTFPFSQFSSANRIALSSSFAKRGANPGQTLTWPLTLTGGSGPYAISIDWGDGKPPQLISLQFAGNFDGSHVYETPGVYIVTVRASDKNGELAFLQLVGVANGPLSQANQQSNTDKTVVQSPPRVVWWPLALGIVFIAIAFWLGSRYRLHNLRHRLDRPE